MPRIASALAPTVPLPVSSAWDADRHEIQCELRDLLASGGRNPVSACMEYVTLGDGQRIRPLLALRVGRLCGAPEPLVLRAAAAIEILHCASLIVDDLPAMDNSAERRGKPSAHVAFGEPAALLASFSMVALAARSITEQPCSERYLAGQRRFQHALLRTLDCASLVGGQMMDVELTGDHRETKREAMNELKTTPLFLLAIEAGTAYADTPPYPLLKHFGREFGAAFQLTDDYLDGELSDRSRLHRQYELTRQCLAPFGSQGHALGELVDYLEERAAAQDRRHR
jgi:geranylgeranyl pyrophosphate synthase